MTKKTFKITGMSCAPCSINIDGTLEDTDGVNEANTSYANQVTEVTFDELKINAEDIVKTIKSAGYDAVLS